MSFDNDLIPGDEFDDPNRPINPFREGPSYPIDDPNGPSPIEGAAAVIPVVPSGPLSVPANFYQWIHDAATQNGIPEALLIAILNRESGLRAIGPKSDNVNSDGTHDRGIAQINSGAHPDVSDAQAYNPQFAIFWAAQFLRGLWDSSQLEGSGDTRWQNVAAAYNGGLGGYKNAGPQAYGAAVMGLTRAPAITIGKNAPVREPGTGSSAPAGLTDDQFAAVQHIADSLFLKYLGRYPTDDEYRDLSRRRLTAEALEQQLRAQPNPNSPGTTVGQMGDLRKLANYYAQQILGRDADEGEIHWMSVNGAMADANVQAFYQQVHDHAVWHGDPATYKATKNRVARIWAALGLAGEPDADTVNAVIDGKMGDDQARQMLRARPAPGYDKSTTVGAVADQRAMVEREWGTYFPGQELSDAMLHKFIGMSPAQVRQYVRDMPSQNTPGVSAGQDADLRTMVTHRLDALGITGEETSPADVRAMAALGIKDAAGIADFLASKPDLAAKYPGLVYGMTSAEFREATEGYGSAITDIFGRGSPTGEAASRLARPGADRASREGTLYGAALADRLSPQELSTGVERFRQERGRAPTGTELRELRARPTVRAVQTETQPAGAQGPSGPVTRTAVDRGEPRPAV